MANEKLFKENTNGSPVVVFDNNNTINISGLSMMENAYSFYDPIFKWINNLDTQINKIEFNLEYLSTSSSLYVLQLIKTVKLKSPNVEIEWNYEDDDESILQLGEELELTSDSKFTFNAIEVE